MEISIQQQDWLNRVMVATGGTLNGRQGDGNCPVCDKRSFRFTIGKHGFLTLACHSGACRQQSVEENDPAWLEVVRRELLGHVPSSAFKPTKQADDSPGPVLPTLAVLSRWTDDLLRRMDNGLDLFGLTAAQAVSADLGWSWDWDKGKGRLVCPVDDPDTDEPRTVLYRSLDGVQPKSRVHKGTQGRWLYAPFGLNGDEPVLLVGGEKDVLAAYGHGFENVACFTNGDGPPNDPERARALLGTHVIIAGDIDAQDHGKNQRLATWLLDVAASVRLADLTEHRDLLPSNGDVYDLLTHEALGPDALRKLIDSASTWATEQADEDGVNRDAEKKFRGMLASDRAKEMYASHRRNEGSSWDDEDLSEVLAGSDEPLMPTVGKREDGATGLFYPGKTHALAGDSEAGKTWLALRAAQQELEQKRHVFFIDFEDDSKGVVGRLVAMGLSERRVVSHFHYSRPDEPLSDAGRDELCSRVSECGASLVILDGVTEAMSQHGWDSKVGEDVAAFYRHITRPLSETGAAVVVIDHLPKYDEKGRGQIGSVHKLNGIDGAVYRLESVKTIAPGREGLTRVKVDKDRPGEVKRYQDEKKRIAEMRVDSTDGDLAVFVDPPGLTDRGEDTEARPGKPLDPTSKLILTALAEGEATPGAITESIAVLGKRISESTVKRRLSDMQKWRLVDVRVESVGKRETGYWSRVEGTSVVVSEGAES